MSQIYKKNTGSASGAIVTIDGDVGSVTGTTVDLFANSGSASCGSSVSFRSASATEMDLVVTDSNNNTIIGQGSGSSTAVSGNGNTGVGTSTLSSLNGGQFNSCIGYSSAFACVSGSTNTCFGAFTFPNGTGGGNTALGFQCLAAAVNANNNTAIGNSSLPNLATGVNNVVLSAVNGGSSYNGSESNNVIISSFGVTGDNNTIRIGTQGSSTSEQDTCYIAGIVGVTVSNAEYVTINSSTGQLGVSPSSLNLNITSVSHAASPYTVLSTDQFLACQTSTGVITIKLPNAPTTGRVIYIKDSNGDAFVSNISVTTVGGTVTIDGQTTYTINSNYGSISVLFDGTNYEVF